MNTISAEPVWAIIQVDVDPLRTFKITLIEVGGGGLPETDDQGDLSPDGWWLKTRMEDYNEEDLDTDGITESGRYRLTGHMVMEQSFGGDYDDWFDVEKVEKLSDMSPLESIQDPICSHCNPLPKLLTQEEIDAALLEGYQDRVAAEEAERGRTTCIPSGLRFK